MLWANLHLLFWLSLVPFGTGWMAAGGTARLPILFYGCILLGAAVAYTLLIRALVALEGPESILAQAIGADRKGYALLALYLLGIGLALADRAAGAYACVAVALIWLVPDPRIEKRVAAALPPPPRRPRT